MKKMKNTHLVYMLFTAVMLIGLTACNDMFNCLDGNGKLRSEYRVVAEFYGVENKTSFSVKITHDSIYSVRVDADENLLEKINTFVRGDNLIIESDNDRCINAQKDILVDIHMPDLNNIILTGSGNIDAYDFYGTNLEALNTGSGDIEIRNLTVDNVNFNVTGSGSISVYGKTAMANYYLSGSGEINANTLEAGQCIAKNSGSGDIFCNVLNVLNVTLSGSGDVIYSGSPSLTKTDTGSGEIRKRD
jgi:hypothetical protein